MDEIDSMLRQQQELDDEIESLSDEQKRLKADAKEKQKSFFESSKALKDEQVKET